MQLQMRSNEKSHAYYELRDRIIYDRYKNLNKEQLNAVFTNEKNLCLVACPGTGKTTTLIAKTDYLVTFGRIYNTDKRPNQITEDDIEFLKKIYLENNIEEYYENRKFIKLMRFESINPKNIIVITFTKASAMNMKIKYKEFNKFIKPPFFGTFHGLFYKILIRYFGEIKIIEPHIVFRLIKNTLSNYTDEVNDDKVNEIINNISKFKIAGNKYKNIKINISYDVFERCFNNYEDHKKEKNLLDFDDLQLQIREIFGKDNVLLNKYRALFNNILVDEFQDCDDIQVDILKMFVGEKNSLFAVGDEDQCIYGFRGSKPEYMVDFGKHFHNGKKLFLSVNYRCPETIVQVSTNLIRNNQMRNNKNMTAFKSEYSKIEIINSIDENQQGNFIAQEIIKLYKLSNIEYDNFTILYRTNIESRSIIDSFIRKRIPFRMLDKEYNFFNHFVCKDIIAYLRLSINPFEKNSFIRIINKPFRYISKGHIEKLKNNYLEGDCFDELMSFEKIHPYQMKNLDKLKKEISSLNIMSLQGAINYILSDLKYMDYIKEYCERFKMDINDFVEIIEEFKISAIEFKNIVSFLSHIEEVKNKLSSKEKIDDEKKVILSTIHGVKGMEFDYVFIINCNEESLPHKNSLDDNIEEERRLFYVAMTRSIKKLFLGIINRSRGKNILPSRFIKECNLGVDEIAPFKKGDRITHKYFGDGIVNEIDNKVIRIEFCDNNIRVFDNAVIINNGLIKKK
ncbi:ATP-dependent helicase [Clostridium sediminicola]|uniref:ATP-dependent helicase n=1 Tax=Clostridium sediminicola TaxID=3114879 RepID=UPI0031F25EA2